MGEKREVLRSYSKIKSFENKIYRLGNTRLGFQLPIGTVAYFIGAVLLVALIDSIIGININPVYKYVEEYDNWRRKWCNTLINKEF